MHACEEVRGRVGKFGSLGRGEGLASTNILLTPNLPPDLKGRGDGGTNPPAPSSLCITSPS